jgi:DNA-binding Lrp family transcriptional regulator
MRPTIAGGSAVDSVFASCHRARKIRVRAAARKCDRSAVRACVGLARACTFAASRLVETGVGAKEERMVAGVVLIRAQREHIATAARAVAEIDGIAEVYSVSGDWDLVAIIRVPEWERIADVVTEQLAKVEGLERTTTLVAFRVFSKKDLAGAFDIFE